MIKSKSDDLVELMLEKETDIILKIVREASHLAFELSSKKGPVESEEKSDGSPVTEVDKALNDLIVGQIKTHFPEDDVVGEESDSKKINLVSHRVWFVDPIDGTKEFIKKSGEWSIMLGLCINNEPVFGLVANPTTSEAFFAVKGHGVFFLDLSDSDSKPKAFSRKDFDLKNLICVSSKSSKESAEPIIMKALGITNVSPKGSIGLKAIEVASGRACLYVNSRQYCSMWDIVPCMPLLNESGCQLVDFELKDIRLNFEEGFEFRKNFLMIDSELLRLNFKSLREALDGF